jgi:hypothetical protein
VYFDAAFFPRYNLFLLSQQGNANIGSAYIKGGLLCLWIFIPHLQKFNSPLEISTKVQSSAVVAESK